MHFRLQRITTILFVIVIATVANDDCCAQTNWLPANYPRWRVPVVNDPTDEDLVNDLRKEADRLGLPILPRFIAMGVDDEIFMRSPNGMIAVRFLHGKRDWEYPWSDESRYDFGIPKMSDDEKKGRMRERIWQDAPYGQFSTDGKNIFFLDEVGYVTKGRSVATGSRIDRRRAADATRYNYLVALNIGREGSLSWKVGGPVESDEGDEPKVTSAFFLGVPVVVDDLLFVMAELDSKIQLIVLDSKDGKKNWSTELIDVGAVSILNDHVRRLAGARPVIAGKTVVCPTTPKKIIGVDIEKHTVRWTYEYEDDEESQSRVGSRVTRLLTDDGKRWADAQAAVAGDFVLATAYESSKLHCLTLKDGTAAWTCDRGDGLFFEVADDNTVLLVGTSTIQAVKIADGKPQWEIPTSLNARPSGRGFVADGFYYLPTNDAQVVRVNVVSGKIEGQVKMDHPLGNLLPYKDKVISHGADWVVAFPRLSDLQRDK